MIGRVDIGIRVIGQKTLLFNGGNILILRNMEEGLDWTAFLLTKILGIVTCILK
jgi:hypothetical protein